MTKYVREDRKKGEKNLVIKKRKENNVFKSDRYSVWFLL